jgi:hypothetical protein
MNVNQEREGERERAVHENFPERWNSHHVNESILDLKKIIKERDSGREREREERGKESRR